MENATRELPAWLYVGSHEPDGEMCVMEAVAWVAGEQWTDRPACACPVITAYCIALNDRMDDEFRQRLLPYVPRLVGTRSTPAVEIRRAHRAADWAVRRFAPAALEAAGLAAQARALQELSPILDADTAAVWVAAAEAARAATAAEAAARAATAAVWVAAAEAARAARAAEVAARAATAAVWVAAAEAARAATAAAAAARAARAEARAAAAAAAAAETAAVGDLALMCLDDLLAITEAGA
jgi:hypothetical protein